MLHDFRETCGQFESQLRKGEKPCIESYLDGHDPHIRAALFELLVQVEIEFHVESGSAVPGEDEFLGRFPDYAESVRRVFKWLPQSISAPAAQPEPSLPDPDLLNDNLPDTEDQQETSAVVVLRVTQGANDGKELRFTDHQTCIAGRSKEAQISLPDDRSSSRYHCRFEIRPPECVVFDLGSTNGTRVNGQRAEQATLRNGDAVTIGDSTVEIDVIQGAPPEAEPEPTLIVPRDAEATEATAATFSDDLPAIPGYELKRELGQGGMGTVYLGKQLSTGKRVAIKLLSNAMSGHPQAVTRFIREASIVLRMHHPRIVKSLDFGLQDDIPYLVMEYVKQLPFSKVFANCELPERVRIASAIMARALQALQYAHDQNLVHRDLKPSNLLLYRSSRKIQVKLADFGLAKNFINAGLSGLTTSRDVCGTVSYMSPEQIIDCRKALPSCDIYSAGVCLYQMLSGRLPFEADHVSRQISLILDAPPTPIAMHVTGLPPEMAAIVDRALQRHPEDRFTSAAEMSRALYPFSKRKS